MKNFLKNDIVYDLSIVIVYDVTLLSSMTYQFAKPFGKKLLHGSMGNKIDKPSIAILLISGSSLVSLYSL